MVAMDAVDERLEMSARSLGAGPWRVAFTVTIPLAYRGILAGLALGSGEFIFWPYITYKAGFIFFWACMLGVCTQFFLNMEIARWTLVTGEPPSTAGATPGRRSPSYVPPISPTIWRPPKQY